VSALTQARAKAVLDSTLGTTAFTAASTSIGIRLMTTNGSESAAGTELSTGGSYTAVTGITVVFDAAVNATGTYSATKSNQAASQTGMPAATIVGIEIWDRAGTPVRQMWGALTSSKTTASGDTLSFAAAAIVGSI
jgi:hypothetical protein